MTATVTLKQIWTATSEWLEIAESQGLEIDWEAEPVLYTIDGNEWRQACEAAGFDPEDDEVGFAVIVEPRDRDTILRAGDIVATSGPGGDVAFLRRS